MILTPHEGEFLRLLGTTDKEISKRSHVKAVRDFAEKHNVILVLKGRKNIDRRAERSRCDKSDREFGTRKSGKRRHAHGNYHGFYRASSSGEVDIFETVVAAVYHFRFGGRHSRRKIRAKRTIFEVFGRARMSGRGGLIWQVSRQRGHLCPRVRGFGDERSNASNYPLTLSDVTSKQSHSLLRSNGRTRMSALQFANSNYYEFKRTFTKMDCNAFIC